MGDWQTGGRQVVHGMKLVTFDQAVAAMWP